MGFMNNIGSFIGICLGKVANKALEDANTFNTAYDKAADMTDEQLERQYKNSNKRYEKVAYAKEYQRRKEQEKN